VLRLVRWTGAGNGDMDEPVANWGLNPQ